MIQIHSDNTNNPNAGGQRVALVTSQSNPNKISIVPADQISKSGCTSSDFTATTVANITKNTSNPVSDENSINEANRIITKPPQPQQQGCLRQETKTNFLCYKIIIMNLFITMLI